jgi:acyl-coenzyme A thioesterase PaaI-like protein
MPQPDVFGQMIDDGWTKIDDDGFVGLIGPFLEKGDYPTMRFAFVTDPRHRNLRGVLQGGALMTFADRALGMTARVATQATRTATVQMDVHFIDAVHIGEIVEVSPKVVRATRQLMFMTAELVVGERVVATANGIWKKLSPPKPETT